MPHEFQRGSDIAPAIINVLTCGGGNAMWSRESRTSKPRLRTNGGCSAALFPCARWRRHDCCSRELQKEDADHSQGEAQRDAPRPPQYHCARSLASR